MIDRDEGMIVFHCDMCPEAIDTEETDFQEAVAVMKGAGWNADRVGTPGNWVHRCPDCSAQYRHVTAI